MELRTVVLVGLWGVVSVGVGARADLTPEDAAPINTTEVFIKVMLAHCSQKYSLTCLKLDVVRLVDKLGRTPSYLLFPGISLVHTNYTEATLLPEVVVASLAEGNVTALDLFLAARVTDYLNSLTLAVKVLDSSTVTSARRLGEDILSWKHSTDMESGRKKGGAALWAAGTMAAVGMAGLAAVSGKALMTSMLALMLAAGGALRGNGGGGDSGKCSNYAYPATKRSIAVQERPVYRPPPPHNMMVAPTYGPPTP